MGELSFGTLPDFYLLAKTLLLALTSQSYKGKAHLIDFIPGLNLLKVQQW